MITRLLFISILTMTVTLLSAQGTKIPLYVGTYTSDKGSKGIYEFEFDTQTGDAKLIRETATPSPSFIDRSSRFLIAANELTDGNQSISSFAITNNGLKFINKVGTGGSAPCHIVMDKDRKFAVASNYLGGALDLFSLADNGEILSKEDTKIYNGSSVDKKRQDASHIHSTFIGPDKLLYVSDLGADKIYVLDVVKDKGGKLQFKEVNTLTSKLGGGPRHIAFHPNGKYLYSLLEMTGDIELFKKVGKSWKSQQVISMRKEGFDGKSGAADLKLSSDGKFLYSTDRVDANTITVFSVAKNGTLKQVQVSSVFGKGPRNFNFSPDERFVLVANQLTDEIVLFNRDKKSGLLSDSGKRIKAFTPVCILF